ncbi:hypothetical protein [Paraburkholderia sp. JHI869]|uniref:hypothetical protein n=1 Tax=Paraburkholderia sp. JHI869 TaxID=3112959 RepID=UPI00317558D6
MVIEVAQKIGPPTLAEVVRRHASHGDNKHDHAGSHTQPRWVHVSLHSCTAAVHRGVRHTMQVSCHPDAIHAKRIPARIAMM